VVQKRVCGEYDLSDEYMAAASLLGALLAALQKTRVLDDPHWAGVVRAFAVSKDGITVEGWFQKRPQGPRHSCRRRSSTIHTAEDTAASQLAVRL